MGRSVVKLNLPGGRHYDIRIGAGITGELGERIAECTPYRHAAIVSDSNVAPIYAGEVATALESSGFDVETIVFEAGEQAKSLAQLEGVQAALSEKRFTRESVVVALGGGVTGDLAGFAASTYMRGVPFVQVPTTLLAMIDSSVGGKNGVNVAGVKNLVGNFAQPIYVSADTAMLGSLPALEWKCGFAEMAKSAIIDSAEFSAWLFDAAPRLVAADPETVREAIARTVEFKARVVVEDERESSKRKCLNYGHTLGHAIEAVSSNPKVLHGIAVAEGMRFAAYLSSETIGVAPGFIEAQNDLLVSLGIEPMRRTFDAGQLVDKMLHDKKGNGRTISFVLPRSPGVWQIEEMDPVVVEDALRAWNDSKE